MFTWVIELRIERLRRMKISFRIETRFRFIYQQSYFHVILALINLNTWIKLPILQAIFISAIMNVDFIPSFIQEWNFDPSLHDCESTFHPGSSVQSGIKNGMNSTGISCNSIRIHLNKYNSIPYDLSHWSMYYLPLPDLCFTTFILMHCFVTY